MFSDSFYNNDRISESEWEQSERDNEGAWGGFVRVQGSVFERFGSVYGVQCEGASQAPVPHVQHHHPLIVPNSGCASVASSATSGK